MTDRPKRTGYNDVAARVSGDEPPAPPPNPHACSAPGCPIGGSIIRDGRKVCFVHFRLPDRVGWDAATARIRNRMPMLEAVRILRSPGSRLDHVAVAQAQTLVPDMALQGLTLYRALTLVERRLEVECIDDGNSLALEQPQRQRVADLVQDLANSRRMPT